MIPKVLSIAGSDPSGGAGIQADLKSFSALGAYGMSVITALTAQNTQGVSGVFPVPVDFVKAQLDTLLADIVPTATKIGMLASAELVETVGEYLPKLSNTVLDPVMVATSGDRLLDQSAIQAIRDLLPKVDLITPNLFEAAALLEVAPASSIEEITEQAQQLQTLGAKRVLVKGGHLDEDASDVLVDEQGIHQLTAHRINTPNTHGTGCTLSSAIAALRPQRNSWLAAVTEAKNYLTDAIAAADCLEVGKGRGPVHHFVRAWRNL